jgi:hypothetical protein
MLIKYILIALLVLFILIEIKDLLKILTIKSNNRKVYKKRKKHIPFK